MKKYLLLASIILSAFLPLKLSAQINVNLNVGSQPLWGPVGYDRAEYYYLPDIESYYYVPKRQFVYFNNNNLVFTSNPPSKYSGYNLYNGYKVVLNNPKPYLNFKNDKLKYAKYKGAKGQASIKYSKDRKYTQVIHSNKNNISSRQARKTVVGSNQKVQVSGSNGKVHENDNKGNKKGKN